MSEYRSFYIVETILYSQRWNFYQMNMTTVRSEYSYPLEKKINSCYSTSKSFKRKAMGKISPRVDIAFKKIFGVDENKDLLISLINSIVSEEDQVTEITLLNPYNGKNFYNDKL